jgi:hypothetical protein
MEVVMWPGSVAWEEEERADRQGLHVSERRERR